MILNMKKFCIALLLTGLSLLCGCADNAVMIENKAEEEPAANVLATVPPDGDPETAACKGSYTRPVETSAVVAEMGDAQLTNGELQVWYWAQVAQYRQGNYEATPDFSCPLDRQPCGVDDSVASWQQYFLKQALNAWHSAQALMQQGAEEGLPTEEAYQPNRKNYETYMEGKPASAVLYGYSESYKPNSMHQAYLDAIPEMLDALAKERGFTDAADLAEKAFGAEEAAVRRFAESHNRGYMYLTSLGYDLTVDTEEMERFRAENPEKYAAAEKRVDIRHILLIPEDPSSEESWSDCQTQAEEFLQTWSKKNTGTEGTFADLANKHSQDTGSSCNGGAYRNLREGQLIRELDSWCFDPARQAGDTTIVRSKQGVHILYFAGARELGYVQAEAELLSRQYAGIIQNAREQYPMEVDYSVITLAEGEGTVSASNMLYPDIAHERFPEVPLYLQQDYPGTRYGDYKITTNGCGITSMAMLASYMTDEEWTPPELCARYGRYSQNTGTDGSLFEKEPANLGFYLIKKSYDWREARDYMKEGHLVVVVQYRGYWTGGGHYLVLEKLSEDGRVQVRDSNIYNYNKLAGHKEDLFIWDLINPKGMGYWIFDHKVTSVPICTRCGDPENLTTSILEADYCCEKCADALLRREAYLTFGGM